MTALSDLLQRVKSEVPGLMLQFPASEAIHGFRVRIKQLRALERLQGQEMAWRAIRDVYRAAGALRDLEQRLHFTGKALGTSHVLYRHLLQTKPERMQGLQAMLNEFDRRAFVSAMDVLENDLQEAAADEEQRVWRQCRRWLRKARFQLRRSNRKDEALHATRKALKQSLHLLQCFMAAEQLKTLRDLEQDIGRWHDEWDWYAQAAAVMGSSGKEAFPGKQAALKVEMRQLIRQVLAFRLRHLVQTA